MRGRKGIVDIDVAERGELFGEGRIVLLLAVVVTKVFQHGHLARLQRIDAALGLVADAVADEADLGALHQLGDLVGNRLQRGVGHRAGLGPAQMRQHDHLGAICRAAS